MPEDSKFSYLQSKYSLSQQKYWEAFREQLRQLNEARELKISIDDIAKGLGVSRQKLITFLNDKENKESLRIQRTNVLQLWDYLTEPEQLEAREISSSVREKRAELRDQINTLDQLLTSIGFLPTSRTSDIVDPQVERIRYRLESPWIQDSAILSHITDNIIDTILDQGGIARAATQSGSSQIYSANQISGWLRKNFKDADDSIIENCVQDVSKFSNLGKTSFHASELFELYQTNFENKRLRNFDIAFTINDCQFKTLSFLLADKFDDSEFKLKISKISFESERRLRAVSESQALFTDNASKTSTEDIKEFQPVIETQVRITLINPLHPQVKQEIISRYEASVTHIEAMFAALSHGVGYVWPNPLKVTNFFIRTISKSLENLVRISIALTDSSRLGKTYQGLWVEHNTVVGILQAVLFAVLNWLSEQLGNANLPKFFDICQEYTQLNHKLKTLLNSVYNYNHNMYKVEIAEEDTDINTNIDTEGNLQEVIRQANKLIEEIKRFSEKIESENYVSKQVVIEFCTNFQNQLLKSKLLAKLASTRASLLLFSAEESVEKFADLRTDILELDAHRDSQIKFAPIHILYASEMMFSRLLGGDGSFFRDKEWRNTSTIFSIDLAFQNLREYISKENNRFINEIVYLAISQFSAVSGFIEFYICQKSEFKFLENASERLISAAHYAARIGQKQRTARLLCHAGRAYCRLGDQMSAMQLISAADHLLSGNQPEMQKASESLLDLSKGEILLLFGKTPEQLYEALYHFFLAWQPYQEIINFHGRKKFLRTKIDSLYNIYRCFRQLEKNSYIIIQDSPLKLLEENLKATSRFNREQVLDIFTKEYGIDSSINCNTFQNLIKTEVINGWNSCHLDHGTHPFAKKVEEDVFLERIDDTL